MTSHHHGHSTDDGTQEPAAEKKLATILEHWIKHNESHVHAYREWAQKASALSMHDVGSRIGEAADLTLAVEPQVRGSPPARPRTGLSRACARQSGGVAFGGHYHTTPEKPVNWSNLGFIFRP
ncbi:MAG: hypothetical protein MZV70_35335 [Desulfobacterales bacterium]|nr:hypothetical protein [Desulfobacterales bacterium]